MHPSHPPGKASVYNTVSTVCTQCPPGACPYFASLAGCASALLTTPAPMLKLSDTSITLQTRSCISIHLPWVQGGAGGWVCSGQGVPQNSGNGAGQKQVTTAAVSVGGCCPSVPSLRSLRTPCIASNLHKSTVPRREDEEGGYAPSRGLRRRAAVEHGRSTLLRQHTVSGTWQDASRVPHEE